MNAWKKCPRVWETRPDGEPRPASRLPPRRPEDFASARNSPAKCVTSNRDEHAKLVKPQLQDERPQFAANLVTVSTTKALSAPNPLLQLNPAVRGAMEYLATRPESHQVMVSLAQSLGYMRT